LSKNTVRDTKPQQIYHTNIHVNVLGKILKGRGKQSQEMMQDIKVMKYLNETYTVKKKKAEVQRK
jgi:hypothetical protein